jgi:hypothetical protein
VVGVLQDVLEEACSDFARSLARRCRSRHTRAIYWKSYNSFWTRASVAGPPPDPPAMSPPHINRWLLMEDRVLRLKV